MSQDDVPSEDMAISAALYVLGDGLNPEAVTQALNIQASEKWRQGDEIPRRRKGPSGRRKNGGWVLRIHGEGREPEKVLLRLLEQLTDRVQTVAATEGVEDAFLDLFMAQDHGSSNAVLDLTPEILKKVAETGLSLCLTFCACDH